jgi:hypothetical protein
MSKLVADEQDLWITLRQSAKIYINCHPKKALIILVQYIWTWDLINAVTRFNDRVSCQVRYLPFPGSDTVSKAITFCQHITVIHSAPCLLKDGQTSLTQEWTTYYYIVTNFCSKQKSVIGSLWFRQSQQSFNTSLPLFYLPSLTTCFGPYGPSSGEVSWSVMHITSICQLVYVQRIRCSKNSP